MTEKQFQALRLEVFMSALWCALLVVMLVRGEWGWGIPLILCGVIWNKATI